MTPFHSDNDFVLHLGDAREVLKTIQARTIDCVVTSPPYYSLRDYGTGKWVGPQKVIGCTHEAARQKTRYDYSLASSPIQDGTRSGTDATAGMWKTVCPSCGARRVDKQIGLEASVDEYVSELRQVFRQLKRVLALHGTVWLNLGDTHRDKQLLGVPWKVAFALQADGWYLRSDIIWAKPNPMPSSVTDRPTTSHEYIFLLTRRPDYFFDQEAVREPHHPDGRTKTTHNHATDNGHPNYQGLGGDQERWPNGGRNVRSVWTIPTEASDESHFASYPVKLIQRCIQAGCPGWVCKRCGLTRPLQPGAGWQDCGHDRWRGGVVLDPFMGTGTTAKAARNLGLDSVGIELSEQYAEICIRRLGQLSLLSLLEVES